MCAFVQATLVADDLAGVEGGAAPGGGLCGVAVEAAAAEVLRLFGGGVVGVLDGEAGVGGRGCRRAGGGGGEGLVELVVVVLVVVVRGEVHRGEGVLELDGLGVVVGAHVREGGAADHGGVVVVVELLEEGAAAALV